MSCYSSARRRGDPAGSNAAISVALEPPGWVRLADVAAALTVSQRTLRNEARRLSADVARKVNGCWWLNPSQRRDWQVALARTESANRRSAHLDAAAWTENGVNRDATIRRLVADADESSAWLLSQGVKSRKVRDRIFCAERGIALATLYKYRRRIKAGDDFRETRGRKRGSGSAGIGRRAWELFAATVLRLKVPAADAMRIVSGKALQHPNDPEWECNASYSTLRRRFEIEFPAFYRDYIARDPEKWAAAHAPKLDRRQTELPANLVWEVDGTPANVLGRNGERVQRFQVVIVGDPASRMVLGCAVGLSESTELIRRALWQAYQAVGAPKIVRVDQGKAFAGQGIGDFRRRKAGAADSEVIGFIRLIQAEPQDTTGRSPWQKGFIESMMRTIDQKHDRLYGKCYIGNRPANRSRLADQFARKHPDKLPTREQYQQTLRAMWEGENRRPRPDFGGLSPLQKFAQTAIPERRLPAHAEEFLRRRPQRVRVGTKGVVVNIGGKPLHYGQRDPRVWERQGQQLIAYIDEADLSNVLLCEVGGQALFYARQDTLSGTTAESIAEAGKLQRKARKRARERFDDIDLACAPTVDVALELKRKAAEAAAAKAEPIEVPERPRIILHTQFDAAVKEAEAQRLRATGTDESVEAPTPPLHELVRQPPDDAMDGVPDLDLADVGFDSSQAREGQDDDPFKHFVKRT